MKQVRTGVVGMGGMGYAHCKSVVALEQTQLTCVCDNEEAVVKEKAEEFGVTPFTDYRKMIQSGLCDAVIIAIPHWFHPDVSVCAFENGLHVLSEKPIAVTVADADRMIKSAQENKRIFSVMLQRRLEPNVSKAFEIVRSGQLGKVIRTLCVDSWYRTQAYYNSNVWRATWKGEGAGVLINQAPHMIDIFMVLGGIPERLEAKTRTRYHQIEVENEVQAILEYSNGACGYYYTSTFEPVQGHYIEICGERGKLVLNGSETRFYRYEKSIAEDIAAAEDMWASLKSEEEKSGAEPDAKKGHIEIIKNFACAIMNGEKLVSPGEEGLYSVEFCNACILSGMKKKPVSLPINREEYTVLIEELKRTSKPKTNVKIQRATDPKYRK
ncbi:MAG TPA: Gfo/Idh/MocA family oxidoreductase [bacterium]|nr:Gfo/Idh/MocA family oxidoreductase [bacterium]